MSTQSTARNASSADPTGSASGGRKQQTYSGMKYGCVHGSITFGHIAKMGDVISDILFQATEGTHQMSLDKNGPRKGWTSAVSPSNFQLECGRDNKKEQQSMMLHARNGDIIIRASNGKIQFMANDIEFNVKGNDSSEGNFTVSATENITFKDAKKFQVDVKSFWKLATPGTAEMVANTQLKTISSVIRGISAGCLLKDSKVGGQSDYIKQTLVA